ncbi:MAG: hypothetical protein V9G19_02485 [Tetrasphaera sp.]
MRRSLLAWGDNSSAQLGRTGFDGAPAPIPVDPTRDGTAISALSTGCGHTLALLDDGTVIGWGRNVFGQAGGGRPGGYIEPTAVPGLREIVAVAAGGGHSIALDGAGRVWGWGAGFFGMLGGIGDQVHPLPQPIDGLDGIVSIAAGGSHNLAVAADGTLLMWGRDDHGQLGDPDRSYAAGRRVVEFAGQRFETRFAPAPVPGVRDPRLIAAGGGHCVVTTSTGQVLTWGFNDRGQLGQGDVLASATPRPLAGLDEVTSVGAAYHHTVAASGDGSVWAFGLNDGGQLGDGARHDRLNPVKAIGLPPVAAVDANGGGSDVLPGNAGHSLALAEDGSVWEWGYLAEGEGQVDAVTAVPTPRRIELPGPADSVHAGGEIPDMSRRATEGEYAEEPTGGFCLVTIEVTP